MELLKIIVDTKKMNNACFLCFKWTDSPMNLFDKSEICDEQFQYNMSLWNIMRELFPTYEILLNQACEDCSTLIIKLFLLLQKSEQNNIFLYSIIEDITNSLSQDICTGNNLKININIPTFDTLCTVNVNKTFSKCKKCNMIFKSKLLLQKHNKIRHNNSNDAIICDKCGKIFVSSSSLKAHLRYHRKNVCPYCFKVLKSHSHFKLHVQTHKQPTIKRKRNKIYYNCDDCNYKTLNKTSLGAHMNKVHLNIRPYICEICKKGFFKKGNLIEHLATHNKFKDKMCDVCGDSFVNDKTLKQHLRLHTGHKPFKCMLCSSSFVNSGRRYEHMARKHKEKNESCAICGKMFSLKKDLNSHSRTVHGVAMTNDSTIINV